MNACPLIGYVVRCSSIIYIYCIYGQGIQFITKSNDTPTPVSYQVVFNSTPI